MRDYTVYCQHARRIEQVHDNLPPVVTLCGAVADEYWVQGSPHKVSICELHLREYTPAPTLVED